MTQTFNPGDRVRLTSTKEIETSDREMRKRSPVSYAATWLRVGDEGTVTKVGLDAAYEVRFEYEPRGEALPGLRHGVSVFVLPSMLELVGERSTTYDEAEKARVLEASKPAWCAAAPAESGWSWFNHDALKCAAPAPAADTEDSEMTDSQLRQYAEAMLRRAKSLDEERTLASEWYVGHAKWRRAEERERGAEEKGRVLKSLHEESKPTWSSTAPTEPGWYWFKHAAYSNAAPAVVALHILAGGYIAGARESDGPIAAEGYANYYGQWWPVKIEEPPTEA